MPDDVDLDKLAKERGFVAPGEEAQPSASGRAPDKAVIGPGGKDDPDPAARVGRGMLKSLAGTAVGVPKVANWAIGKVSPRLSQRLGDLAEQVPGVTSLENFAESKNETWAETFGNLGGIGLQLLAGPGELKLGEMAMSRTLPGLWKGGEFAGEAGKAAGAAAPQTARAAVDLPGKFTSGGIRATEAPAAAPALGTAKTWGTTLSETADRAIRGGMAGIIADPNDPGANVLSGAAGGGAVYGLGKFAGTSAGRALLAAGVSTEAGYQLYEYLRGRGGMSDRMIEGLIGAGLFLGLRGNPLLSRLKNAAENYIGSKAAGAMVGADPRIGGGIAGEISRGLHRHQPDSHRPPSGGGSSSSNAQPSFKREDLLKELQ